jgi:hypothetical protein
MLTQFLGCAGGPARGAPRLDAREQLRAAWQLLAGMGMAGSA